MLWAGATPSNPAWLGDGSGILFNAPSEDSNGVQMILQLRLLTYPNGKARQITHDLNGFKGVSVSADGTALITVQTVRHDSLWIAPEGKADRAWKIRDDASSVDWTPDGRIVYGSEGHLWIMSARGENQRRLTRREVGNRLHLSVGPGAIVFFPTIFGGNGEVQGIKRLDLDGGNPKQLTKGDERGPCLSPDGKWVVYQSSASGVSTLWRVPADGGEPVQITHEQSEEPSISPDGKLLLYTFQDEKLGRRRLAVIPFQGGPPIKALDFPDAQWAPDGRGFVRTEYHDGAGNLWELPLNGGKPRQLTDFISDRICGFGWSPDGKQLAVCRETQTSDAVLIKDFK